MSTTTRTTRASQRAAGMSETGIAYFMAQRAYNAATIRRDKALAALQREQHTGAVEEMCDRCPNDVPNGSGIYLINGDRVCDECAEADTDQDEANSGDPKCDCPVVIHRQACKAKL